jgi:hypothetical protein
MKAMATRQSPGTGVLGQATTGNPLMEEAGQGDDDNDNLVVLSHQRPGKQRSNLRSTATGIRGSPASRISSTALSVPGSQAPAPVARSSAPSKASETESDSSPRPNKRARAKGQDRDGDDSSDDGAKRGELRWRGTKQPVKRGGRRF